jgi:hypothetical protein
VVKEAEEQPVYCRTTKEFIGCLLFVLILVMNVSLQLQVMEIQLPDMSKYVAIADLEMYVETSTALKETLDDYTKTTDLAVELRPYAKSSETSDALETRLAAELKDYTALLQPYAKSAETSAALETALEEALEDYTKKTDLAPYAKSSETSAALEEALEDYTKKTDLAPYAKSSETSAALETALEEYTKISSMAD